LVAGLALMNQAAEWAAAGVVQHQRHSQLGEIAIRAA
jgi:hypothetical protein